MICTIGATSVKFGMSPITAAPLSLAAVELIGALQAGTPGAEEEIASLCGAVTEDASRLVLAHGRTLALRLLDVDIVLAHRHLPGPRSLH